jgi:hypothetical protein
MSDDLVKRLRMVTGFIRFETGDSACLSEEAADRIEAQDVAIAELVEGLRALVKQNEDWNAAVMQVTGKPAGWTDKYLSPARALIAKYGDKT